MYRATLPSPTRDATNLLKRFVTLFRLFLYYVRTYLGCVEPSFVVQVFKISKTAIIIGVLKSHVDDITHFQSNMGMFILRTKHIHPCFYDVWDVFDNFIHDKIIKYFVLIFGLNWLDFVRLKKKARVELFIRRINS